MLRMRSSVTATRIPGLFAGLIAVLLASCASPPKPIVTAVRITIQAEADVNPDQRGRPSPVMLRLFELKALAAFESADFFALAEKAPEVLGPELTARADLPLQPNQTKSFDRTLDPQTRFIGVMAEFRDLERAQWRSVLAIPIGKTSPVTVRLKASSVSIGIK